ncbi:hypothetical protein ABRY97_03070 [Castellaniella ginsengisoli]|uniref:Uncharacterized protein n=1 Tax=Castellaniella ginsengisoli TaxID=546114 RepID=A0AB39DDU1_9BURK
MSQADRAALKSLGKAVKRVAAGDGTVLCPYCSNHRVQVLSMGDGRIGRCPECGPVEVGADDFEAWQIDDDWMQRSLRRALEIQSHDGIDQLADGVWRIGDIRKAPVVLARDIMRILKVPGLLDRVRVACGTTQLITPTASDVQGVPFGASVQWLRLQERFILYGDGISAIGQPECSSTSLSVDLAASVDPTLPVYGPFSEDFRWVTTPEIQGSPIRLTPMQAAIFKALWQLKGKSVPGQRVMQAAGSTSTKPGDLFKHPNHALARRAFDVLVEVNNREGLYALPCARNVSTA